MEPNLIAGEVKIDVLAPTGRTGDLETDTIAGLAEPFKELSPKYFYDELGSQLFEQITELPEYYPTRAEREILETRGAEIIEAAGNPTGLIELGSGSASKTRLLLDAMRDAGCLERFVPVDISEEITRSTAEALIDEYPGLDVHGIVCDFEDHLEALPAGDGTMIAFLGGTIGNLHAPARRDFLTRIASVMGPDDRLLLGTDLVKDTARLEAAYDDSQGVTQEFNKNVLNVLNRELGADFDLAKFAHRAFFDTDLELIDIRLVSLAKQTVHLPKIDMTVEFEKWEEMRTEISCKFTEERLAHIYESAGLQMTHFLTDAAGDFALSIAAPDPKPPAFRLKFSPP